MTQEQKYEPPVHMMYHINADLKFIEQTQVFAEMLKKMEKLGYEMTGVVTCNFVHTFFFRKREKK